MIRLLRVALNAADAAKRIDLKDLGMSGGGMFDRGVPGMCQELAQ